MSNGRNATPKEVAKVERAIDASLEALRLPAEEFFQALWHFLTVSEDIPRMMVLRSSGSMTEHGESDETMRLSCILDDHKYALRYILDLIDRRLPRARTLPKRIKTGEASYITAARSLAIARDYRTAVRLFTLYHSREGVCTIDESGDHLWFSFPAHSEAYLTVEYSVGIEDATTNMMLALFAWLRFPDDAPALVKQIGDSVAAVNEDRLVYNFDRGAARELARILPNPKSWDFVPPSWAFPWGNRAEVMSLWNSLLIRCAYHLLAINFGASRLQITGGGVDDLCLRIKQGELVQNIRRISEAPVDRIVRFVQGITYGRGTQTPDPALQPLMPCGGGELLVPCTQILSSSNGRNLLSLHARVDKESFNSQSAAFEQAMVEDVAALASGRFPLVRTQFNFRPTGEIDLVIVDDRSATILIGELRWMIPPGDPREIVNRMKVCREKVIQVEKKVRGVKKDTLTFLRRLGWKGSRPASWEVVGFVITENFGFRSSNADIPMLPLDVLRVGLTAGINAQQLHLWLKSERWLPRKGEHFHIVQDDVRFDLYTLSQYSLANPRPLQYIREFLPTTVKEFG
jgi:hypothetical protein